MKLIAQGLSAKRPALLFGVHVALRSGSTANLLEIYEYEGFAFV